MKIIEELQSLESGNDAALFSGDTGLKFEDTPLFDFAATIAALNALQLKYPNHRLFIGNKGEWDWSEFALFGEREETDKERQDRIQREEAVKQKEMAAKQKQIDKLKKQAKKLGLKVYEN